MPESTEKEKQRDRIGKLCQKCRDNPVIVLGSGASIPHGVRGMTALATFLKGNVTPIDGDDETSWSAVVSNMESGQHLEAALEGVSLSPNLVHEIIENTWRFIAEDDFKLFKKVIEGTEKFPLTTLLSKLFQSSQRTIQVITPNYDRVVEFAADMGGFIVDTGFLPGYYRRPASSAVSVRYEQGNRQAKTVRLLKVHGSIDWFKGSNDQVISLPLFCELLEGLTPQIVTPGVSKYEATHGDPYRSAIHQADDVLRGAASIICVGYGFRDQHLQPKLIERCQNHNVPVLLAARTLTVEARDFLKNHAGVNHVGLEKSGEFTKVYSRSCPDGEIIEDNLWELRTLTEELLF